MIEINNLTTTPISEEFLEKVVRKVLKEEKRKENLSIAIIGQGRMKKLNKKYRGKNQVTDILSFPTLKVPFEKFKIGDFQKIEGLGEIVICLKEIKKNTKRFCSSFEKELTKVLIHGILHLLGYDHEKSERDAKKMSEKENYYFKKIF